MRILRLGLVALLAAGTWLGLGAGYGGDLSAFPPRAAAQGTLTPPAGQTRATAPGGTRGRGARRHRGGRPAHPHSHHSHRMR